MSKKLFWKTKSRKTNMCAQANSAFYLGRKCFKARRATRRSLVRETSSNYAVVNTVVARP